jgi:hypothetical protein
MCGFRRPVARRTFASILDKWPNVTLDIDPLHFSILLQKHELLSSCLSADTVRPWAASGSARNVRALGQRLVSDDVQGSVEVRYFQ